MRSEPMHHQKLSNEEIKKIIHDIYMDQIELKTIIGSIDEKITKLKMHLLPEEFTQVTISSEEIEETMKKKFFPKNIPQNSGQISKYISF